MKRKYWYQTTIEFCPVCGSEDRYRERVYEKPEVPIILKEHYDWCEI